MLLDLNLPDSSGLDTFKTVHAATRDVPVIVLSGLDDETTAVNAVHAGAEDYLVKDRLSPPLVLRSIIYAMERTQAKKAAQTAQEKYRSIFENSVSGIFQTSPEGRYLNVNPALARIYGYGSTEELMSRISDIARLLYVDPNRRAEFIKLMQAQGVVKDFESQIHRKDGSVIWISENARAVRDADGQIEYYEGMVEDITARKEAEEKLRFSEMRFRSVWQNSNDGMRLTDAEGMVLAVNRSYCQHCRPALRRIGGAVLHRRLRRERGDGGDGPRLPAALRGSNAGHAIGTPRHLPVGQDGGLRAVQFFH